MYLTTVIELVLGIIVITLFITGWKFDLNILKLSGLVILYTWMTINFMNIIRETGSVPKKILFTLLILINLF